MRWEVGNFMLMYLTSWQEQAGELQRCWKGYDFGILDELAERDLIPTSRGAKSAYLTKEGEREAQSLLSHYGIETVRELRPGGPGHAFHRLL